MGGEADGALELQRAVRDHLKAGVDWIKVMATGGNMTAHTNTFAAQYTVDELRVIIADAHRLRRKVTAHAHGLEGIRVAVEAGVDMIEHCTFSVPGGIELDEAVLKAIAEKGIVVSPTTSVGYRNWRDDGQRERRKAVTRAIFAHGCKVIMSTDCGIPGVPHTALAGGMSVLQELSGLPAVEILKLATQHVGGATRPRRPRDHRPRQGWPTYWWSKATPRRTSAHLSACGTSSRVGNSCSNGQRASTLLADR